MHKFRPGDRVRRNATSIFRGTQSVGDIGEVLRRDDSGDVNGLFFYAVAWDNGTPDPGWREDCLDLVAPSKKPIMPDTRDYLQTITEMNP